MQQIGFIGVGVMGGPMAANLLEKGFRVLPCSWRDLDGVDALIKYFHFREKRKRR